MKSPFAVLGLPENDALSDDDVRSAWRRIATATHPDRGDGGDLAAYAAAAAAYSSLRTASARGEALADLRSAAPGSTPGRHVPVPDAPATRPVRRLAGGIRGGRPLRLVVRLLAAAGVSALAVITVGWQPSGYAIIAGACTWLAVTGRSDLGR